MYCGKCGMKMKKGNAFCTNCGKVSEKVEDINIESRNKNKLLDRVLIVIAIIAFLVLIGVICLLIYSKNNGNSNIKDNVLSKINNEKALVCYESSDNPDEIQFIFDSKGENIKTIKGNIHQEIGSAWESDMQSFYMIQLVCPIINSKYGVCEGEILDEKIALNFEIYLSNFDDEMRKSLAELLGEDIFNYNYDMLKKYSEIEKINCK